MPLTQYPGWVQVFKQILAPREPKLVTHNGYEWLYVLAGTLRPIIGEHDVTLRAGEVADMCRPTDRFGARVLTANPSPATRGCGGNAGTVPWF